MSFSLRFTRRFSMAHRLIAGTSQRCATPHGHNEFVIVELEGKNTRLDGHENMVVEFGAAKSRWHHFVDNHLDHSLQLSDKDPLVGIAEAQFPNWRLVITPGDPTTELLALLLAAKCQTLVNGAGVPLQVRAVTIEETPTNAVRFAGNPREFLPAGGAKTPWWWRNDMSTRD